MISFEFSYIKLKTLRDVLEFVFDAVDLPLQLEETPQKYIQAHKCLNNYKQTGILPDDRIKETQNKIDKILYIVDNRKGNPDSFWGRSKELYEIIDIVADSNGCTRIK